MRPGMRGLRRLARCERGGAAVEFAIIALALVMVSLGAVEFGRALLVRNDLSFAADFGARKVLNDPTITNSALESEIRANFLVWDTDPLAVTIGSEVVDGREFRTIAMTYPFTPVVPGLTDTVITLKLGRRVPII